MTITESFERFQYFNFEASFLEYENLFQETGVQFFQLKVLRLKTRYFHSKLSRQKLMLRQTEW